MFLLFFLTVSSWNESSLAEPSSCQTWKNIATLNVHIRLLYACILYSVRKLWEAIGQNIWWPTHSPIEHDFFPSYTICEQTLLHKNVYCKFYLSGPIKNHFLINFVYKMLCISNDCNSNAYWKQSGYYVFK